MDVRDYDSSVNFVSSIIMSLNSLDSKISPHSLHSTYSESSSRDTICTRGCLHGGLGTFAEADGGGIGVINPVYERPAREGRAKLRKLAVFLALARPLSSLFRTGLPPVQYPYLSLEPPDGAFPCNGLRF